MQYSEIWYTEISHFPMHYIMLLYVFMAILYGLGVSFTERWLQWVPL